MSDSERYEEFIRLLRLNTSQVLAYINALLVNWNDAEDLFQETCLVLWQKYDNFQPGTNFLAWALRIAELKVMNFQTTQSRRVAFAASLRDAIKADFANQSAQDVTANLMALSGCMDRLTPNDRKMATLCYGECLPVRQVADAMGRPPQSVYRSLRRIRSWLLDCIRRELKQVDAPVSIRPNILTPEDRP